MQRMTSNFLDLLFTQPAPTRPRTPEVVFKGRNRHDTQRAVLRYWAANETRLGMEFDEFRRHCTWTGDESIVFASDRR